MELALNPVPKILTLSPGFANVGERVIAGVEIGKNGWNIVGNFDLGKTKTISAVKSTRSLVVSLSENDNGTSSISISVVEPKS